MNGNVLIGVDCQAVDYFERLPFKENVRFYYNVFTEDEIKYSLSKARPAQHFAVRYAAKEATIKALSNFGLKYNQIRILNEKGGKPIIKLEKEEGKRYDLKVSLSHSGNMAIAVIIGVIKKSQLED